MVFSWIEAAIVTVIVTVIVMILAAIGWEAYSNSQRPTIEIKKDEWECVKSEHRTRSQPMLVGKVTILLPITRTVCVEYRRHAG